MHKRLLVRMTSLALGLGLSTLVLLPGTAHAILVQCADETGDCEVSNNDFDYISCTCVDDSAFGGTGGMDWVGMTEDELMQVCLDQLASCSWGDTAEMGSDTGWNDDWGDWGESESGWIDTGEWGTDDWNDTFGDGWETFGDGEWGDTFGDTGMVTDGGESESGEGDDGSSTEDGSDSGTDDWDTFNDDFTDSSGDSDTGDATESGEESDSQFETGGDTSGSGDDELGESESGGDAGVDIDAGCNCSTTNDPGAGVLALLGLLGLLGLRRREP
jgi:MYXO-CTERM domain-containing protein